MYISGQPLTLNSKRRIPWVGLTPRVLALTPDRAPPAVPARIVPPPVAPPAPRPPGWTSWHFYY